MKKNLMKNPPESGKMSQVDRRKFLRIGSLAIAGAGLVLYGCDKDELDPSELNGFDDARRGERGSGKPRQVFNLKAGDEGILRYAYLLEQLEAAFYAEVVNGGFWMNDATPEEKKVLEDLYRHELIHRDWFEQVVISLDPSERAKGPVEFDFSGVDFSSADAVFQTSIILEDTGVSAYNGAGPLLDNLTYLGLAGKIVSVEARHASAVRSLYAQRSPDMVQDPFKYFAGDDVVDANGLDVCASPQMVLQAVSDTGFVVTKINSDDLPTS